MQLDGFAISCAASLLVSGDISGFAGCECPSERYQGEVSIQIPSEVVSSMDHDELRPFWATCRVHTASCAVSPGIATVSRTAPADGTSDCSLPCVCASDKHVSVHPLAEVVLRAAPVLGLVTGTTGHLRDRICTRFCWDGWTCVMGLMERISLPLGTCTAEGLRPFWCSRSNVQYRLVAVTGAGVLYQQS